MTSDDNELAPWQVPKAAALLTAAGALPFVFLSLAAFIGYEPFGRPAVPVLALYALTILSFMGAIHWGLAMGRPNSDTTWSYLTSVVPPLVGWFALAFLPMRTALLLIAAAFALLVLYDIRATRLGVAPHWYPRLRIPVTVAVVASLLLGALAA